MAYMKLKDSECLQSGCTKRATHTVFNYRNSPYGDYCKQHAEDLIARIERNRKACSPKGKQ